MKHYTRILFIFLIFLSACDGCEVIEPILNTFVDGRDGQTYTYVQIEDQVWMGENLRYDNGNAPCYDNSKVNCSPYGRYYSRDDVMDGGNFSNNVPSGVKGICPDDWHLPSKVEWEILFDNYMDGFAAYSALIDGGSSGFDMPLSGSSNISYSSFEGKDEKGFYWSTTEANFAENEVAYFNNLIDKAELLDYGASSTIPCRCIKD